VKNAPIGDSIVISPGHGAMQIYGKRTRKKESESENAKDSERHGIKRMLFADCDGVQGKWRLMK
jgi:hypothetical protein